MRCPSCGREISSLIPCPCGARPRTPDAPLPARGFRFDGSAGELFPIFIRCVLLSIVTLGIYSFWARSEFRRYLLTHLQFADDRFDYLGTGRELFLGFLRALPILAVLAGLLILGSMTENPGLSVLCYLGFYFGIMAVLPGAIALSWRYRLSRTTWRGVRFSWRGSVAEVYREAFLGGLITVFTLGICYPLLRARLRRALIGRSYFGNVPFEHVGDGHDLVGPWFLAGILSYFTLGLYMFWFQAREQRYIFRNTFFRDAEFTSYLKGDRLLGLHVGNLFLLVLSLGLAWPVAAVRSWRTVTSAIFLEGHVDFDGIVQEYQAASAGGDALDSAIDADVAGLDFGM